MKYILFVICCLMLHLPIFGGELPFELKTFKDPTVAEVASIISPILPSGIDQEKYLRDELARLLVFEVCAEGENENFEYIRSLLSNIKNDCIKGYLHVIPINNKTLNDYAKIKKLLIEMPDSESKDVAYLLFTFSPTKESTREEEVVIYMNIK